jgi:hypothetical protein
MRSRFIVKEPEPGRRCENVTKLKFGKQNRANNSKLESFIYHES